MVKPPAANNPSTSSELLHLLIFDADDLAIVSAHVQDAIARIADMAYRPQEKRFALLVSRFDWSAASEGLLQRRMSGLHFDHVYNVQRQGFEQHETDAVLNLLRVDFEPAEAPGGTLNLTFSGGAAIRLDIECIEGQMNDLGPRWRARKKPSHDTDAGISGKPEIGQRDGQ